MIHFSRARNPTPTNRLLDVQVHGSIIPIPGTDTAQADLEWMNGYTERGVELMESCSPLPEKEILMHDTTWMNLEGFMLRAISQSQQDKYYMTLLNMKNHRVIRFIEIEKQNKG